MNQQLILASESSYKKNIFKRLNLPFFAHAPSVDETPTQSESARALTIRLAGAKAQTISKLGVDRRVITAGDNKAMLDPFLPESLEDTQHLQGLLDATHQQFIARVREGRGERLTPGDEDVFDGRVWSGEQALVLGLVDSLAGPLEVAREWIGAEERIYYTQDEPLLNQFSREFGFGVGTALTWLGRQGILNPWSLSH